ncbi:beta-N-acetylhexosaminidase [Oribacterium sp. KHPX15]|nr:beta-N-acetylhexosaminidase [Oribacterium sp. KHPX15]
MMLSKIRKKVVLMLLALCLVSCARPVKSPAKEASRETVLENGIGTETETGTENAQGSDDEKNAPESVNDKETVSGESQIEVIVGDKATGDAEKGELPPPAEIAESRVGEAGADSRVKEIDANAPVDSGVGKSEVAASADSKLEKGESAAATDAWVEARLSGMTLEEKVAQLFFVTPEALTGVGQVIQTGDTSRKAFSEYPVGGIIYFAWNLQTPEQAKQMIGGMSEYALSETGIPVFLAVDEEGGRVTRFEKNPEFGIEDIPAMKKIGDTKDPEEAYKVGATIGEYLNEYGINLDLAPDADVFVDANNTAIGDRSFGSDPYLVSAMALAYAEGLKSHDVLACYKHYPGHGGTKEDTHEDYAYSYKTLDELMNDELVPFSDAAKNDIPLIMVSHISLPEIHGDDTPASLSKYMITDVLRGQLGYEGLIITDALDMGAISNHYSHAEACRKALLAGNDMLLMSGDFRPGYEAILDAVKSGEISEDRIDESVRRILRTKKRIA